MASVTARIKEIKQPRGGYLNIKKFKLINLENKKELFLDENISPINVGLAVDYLTRTMTSLDVGKSFSVSLDGARRCPTEGTVKKSLNLLNKIKGLDDESIISASKLVSYDVYFRNKSYKAYIDIDSINPDKETIENIRIMVERTLDFLKNYGPILEESFTFEGGYTRTVNSGDGDILTKDTLWDFKVSKNLPTSDHTLQLLMYYIMAKHSNKKTFRSINKIGIFNPRLNCIWIYEISTKDNELITEIENNIICY